MPVVEIRALPQKPPVDAAWVLGKVCTELAKVLGVPESQVWGTWQTLEPGHYVEGRDDLPDQSPDTHPPLVRIQAFEGRPPDLVRVALGTVARSLEAALGLGDGNVMVVWEELPAGRVWSGGRVLE